MNILVPTSRLEEESSFFRKTDTETIARTYGNDIADMIEDETKLRNVFGPCMVSQFCDFLYKLESRPDIKTCFFSNDDVCDKISEPVTFIIHSNGFSDDKLLFTVNKGIQITKAGSDSKVYVRAHSFQTAPLIVDGLRYHIDKDNVNRYETAEIACEGKENSAFALRITPKHNCSFPLISHYVKGNDNIDRAYKHISDLKERLNKELRERKKEYLFQKFSTEEIAFCAGIVYRLADKN